MHAPEYDVLIAGCGVVGATLACALAGAGLQVGVVEARPAQAIDTSNLDLRVYALTRASERIFRNLGAWDDMAKLRVSPFRAMEVWDSQGSGRIHFDSATIVEPLLGHIVEQNIIQVGLNTQLQQLIDNGNLHLLQPAHITQFQLTANAIEAQLDSGQTLSARLLVGAEGANSPIRNLAGIPCQLNDYAHSGLVANLQTELPHQAVARQRFLGERGILAFLPLKDSQQVSIVWSCPKRLSDRLMQLATPDFEVEVAAAFEHHLGAVQLLGDRAVFPLIRRHAQHYVQPRLALVGDAAHTIHPLAGQGVNLGLLDVACLAQVLLESHASGQDLGHYAILRRYERWRRGDNGLMQGLMDSFKTVFAESLPPVRWLRNIGLHLTNHNEAVKNVIMRQAMGLTGDLPQLARMR